MSNENSNQSSLPKISDTIKQRVLELYEDGEPDSYLGICLACGSETEGVEPDTRNYECESCEASQVFGVEELLTMCAP